MSKAKIIFKLNHENLQIGKVAPWENICSNWYNFFARNRKKTSMAEIKLFPSSPMYF